jgi:hypothetical protein
VHALERDTRHQGAVPWHGEQRGALDREKGAKALAAAKCRVAHGIAQPRRTGALAGNLIRGQQAIEQFVRTRRDFIKARNELCANIIPRHDKSRWLRFPPADIVG